MASEVSICNRALQILGASSILALNEDSKNGREMTRAYQPLRDAELERHWWRFATKRKSVAALAAAPAFGYGYQYQVPDDFIALRPGGDLASVADLTDYRATSDSALYALEGRVILTDLSSPLDIIYTAKITDPNVFSPAFCEALSARIADETCEVITGSDSKRELCMRAYNRAMSEARRANALQRATVSPADGSWLVARGS